MINLGNHKLNPDAALPLVELAVRLYKDCSNLVPLNGGYIVMQNMGRGKFHCSITKEEPENMPLGSRAISAENLKPYLSEPQLKKGE